MMVARLSGSTLGLLAFAVTAAAGLFSRNPVEVILSRSIFASIIFCALGLVLGGVAQLVITDHKRQRSAAIRRRYREDDSDNDKSAAQDGSPPAEALAGTP